MAHNTTIVTTYINISKYDSRSAKRSELEYKKQASDFLLKIPLPMYIYVESENEDFVREERTKYGLESLTKIVVLDFSNLSHSGSLHSLGRGRDKGKKKARKSSALDNSSYVVIINSKAEFVSRSMKDDYFNSNYFYWLDFSIGRHRYTESNIQNVLDIAANPHGKVSLGLINKYEGDYDELMTGYKWLTIGGSFTVPNEGKGKAFLNKWIAEYNSATAKDLYPYEEAIFYKMWMDKPKDFIVYNANYDTCLYEYFNVLMDVSPYLGKIY